MKIRYNVDQLKKMVVATNLHKMRVTPTETCTSLTTSLKFISFFPLIFVGDESSADSSNV